MSLKSGKIVFIKELVQSLNDWEGESVRVTGLLVTYDVHTNLATIQHNDYTLTIDTSLLGVFSHRINGLFQFVGELSNQNPQQPQKTRNISEYLLLARVVRNMEGLDLQLYEKAIAIRKKFEKDRKGLGF
ncbi:hypothetical protein K7432_010867 [Basidiobolus ranarum]|uniref:CST complex subunit TEN1 n=1 Tax=Basidiobolus ranarum TaxID=34480 RepID=A0ABR2VUX4_9FUNG